ALPNETHFIVNAHPSRSSSRTIWLTKRTSRVSTRSCSPLAFLGGHTAAREPHAGGGRKGRHGRAGQDALRCAAGRDRGLAAARTHPCRPVPDRAGPPGEDLQVDVVPARGRGRQPERGDAVGAERGAERAVLPARGTAAARRTGDQGGGGARGGRRTGRLRGDPARLLPAQRP